jgi:hypothetical protein
VLQTYPGEVSRTGVVVRMSATRTATRPLRGLTSSVSSVGLTGAGVAWFLAGRKAGDTIKAAPPSKGVRRPACEGSHEES